MNPADRHSLVQSSCYSRDDYGKDLTFKPGINYTSERMCKEKRKVGTKVFEQLHNTRPLRYREP